MRNGFIVAALLCGVGRVAGQDLADADRSRQAPLTALETQAQEAAVGQQHRLAAQVQFGLPTGVRAQYAAYRGGDHSYLLEVFGGAQSAFWGEKSVVGVGGRALFTLTDDGRKNALLFGPGLGVAYWQRERDPQPAYSPYGQAYSPAYRPQTDRYFLTIDATLSWLHEFSPAFGWEVGLNLGARVGVSGEERGGRTISGRVSGGVIGLFTGFRY